MRLRTILLAALALAVVPGCPKDEKNDDEKTKEEQAAAANQAADDALALGDLATAQGKYAEAVALLPSDAHAAAGSAITDLLNLADSAPVDALLDACNQPHFDFDTKVFGPAGMLMKDKEARQGSGTLKILSRAGTSGSFADTGFSAEGYRSYRDGSSNLGLEVHVTGSATSGNARFYLGLDPRAALTDGMQIDLADPMASGLFDSFGWGLTVGDISAQQLVSGTVTFHGSQAVGATFTLDFTNVLFTACPDGQASWTCDGSGQCTLECNGKTQLQLSGSVTDTVSEPAGLDEDELPFGTIESDDGPPHRDAFIVALDHCSSTLSTDFVAQKAEELADHLDSISARLDVAIGSAPAEASFALPKALFGLEKAYFADSADVPLNGADLLTLRAATHAFSAALHLVASYRYLDGPLASFIGNFTYWYNSWDPATSTYVPASRAERGFLLSALADNLNGTFLARAAGFDLAPVKSNLDAALADASAALKLSPTKAGLLNFQASGSLAFANQLAEQLDLLRQSLTSDNPVALARNPLYKVSLKKFFDAPLDHTSLLANAGLTRLFDYVAGDATAEDAYDRNGRLEMASPEKPDDVETWTGGVLTLPHEVSTSCTLDSQCPQYYRCNGSVDFPGTCEPADFVPVDESTTQGWDGELPPFLNPGLESVGNLWSW